MGKFIDNNVLTQVALIVRDIEATARKFAEFLDIPVPQIIGAGSYEITQTTYKGNPAPNAACKMAFFPVGANVMLELIEPNEEPSVWRDFLNERGEGLHHIAFNVKDMDGKVKTLASFGAECVQRGKYGDGNGEYAYFDATGDLKCYIELLENY